MDDFGLKVGRYSAVLPTLIDSQVNELQVDVNGRLLVQADISVLIDFLGLNGASDNANILVVGTESGTPGGVARVLRLASDGAVAVQDNGGSLTVDAVDLDIRDLSALQDNIAISDGIDTLVVNPNGSINVATTYERFSQIANASNWMDLANFNAVVPSIAGNDLTLSYLEDGALLGEAVITNYESLDNWNLELKRYIDDDDGSPLQDDNDTNLNLD